MGVVASRKISSNVTLLAIAILLVGCTSAQEPPKPQPPSLQRRSHDSCAPVERNLGDGSSFFQVWVFAKDIAKPGSYCLSASLSAPRAYVWSEGGEKGMSEALLKVKSSDIDLDLQGLTLEADTRDLDGIVSLNRGKNAQLKNVHIHDGSVISRTGFAIRLDDLFPGDYGSLRSAYNPAISKQLNEFIERDRARFFATISQFGPNFPASGHQLERLRLKSGNYAIAIKGGGNVIRNSVIEVDDCGGLMLVGPNQVIEDNEIVVKTYRKGCAPITLIAAHGSIVRRNRIIAKSDAEIGVSLLGSKDVVMDGNKFEGVKNPVDLSVDALWGKSTVIER